MIKRYNKGNRQNLYFRINERISALTLRVLDAEGKQIGVLNKAEALQKAREEGLDLVEVAPTAKPPVARIIDYNKFLYQQEKKKKEEKKKNKASETKEVRLGPFMNDHDLDVMTRRAKEFLEDNNKVRLVLKFKGRQITHPEFGYQTIKKVTNTLADVSRIEREAHLEGKQLIALLATEKKKGKTDEKDQEISTETV